MLDMDSDLIKYEPTRLTSHYYMKIIMSCQTLLTSIFIDTADSYYFQEQCWVRNAMSFNSNTMSTFQMESKAIPSLFIGDIYLSSCRDIFGEKEYIPPGDIYTWVISKYVYRTLEYVEYTLLVLLAFSLFLSVLQVL